MTPDPILEAQKLTIGYTEGDIATAQDFVRKLAKNKYQAGIELNVNPYHVHRLMTDGHITPTMARALGEWNVVEEKVIVEVPACKHCGQAHLAKGCPVVSTPDPRRRATVNVDKPELVARVLWNRMTREDLEEVIDELTWRLADSD